MISFIYSTDKAKDLANKRKKHLKKLDIEIPLSKCLDMISWENGYDNWQIFSAYLKGKEKETREKQEKQEKKEKQTPPDFSDYLDQLGIPQEDWKYSRKLKSFFMDVVEKCSSPSFFNDTRVESILLDYFEPLVHKMSKNLAYMTTEEIVDLLKNHQGIYLDMGAWDDFGDLFCRGYYGTRTPKNLESTDTVVFPNYSDIDELLQELTDQLYISYSMACTTNKVNHPVHISTFAKGLKL